MADHEPTRILEPVISPQHYVPPTERELRSQAVHRLQVGLFGLCAMLLIVGLANIIMDTAKDSDRDEPVEEALAADDVPKKTASDPLADIGVVPSAGPAQASGTSPDPEATPDPLEELGVDIGQ